MIFDSKSVKIAGLLCWSLPEAPGASWKLLELAGVFPGASQTLLEPVQEHTKLCLTILYYTMLCYSRLYYRMII